MTFIDNRTPTTTLQKIVQWFKYNGKELITSFYLVVIQMFCWSFPAILLEFFKCDIIEKYTFLYLSICIIFSYAMIFITISKPPKD